jgi:hypothetical protein
VGQRAHQAAAAYDLNTLDQLQDELDTPPTEFHSHPGLMGILLQGRTVLAAVAATSSPLTLAEQLATIDRFLEAVSDAMEEEQRLQATTAQQRWRQWVKNSMGVNAGWAHKWSRLSSVWKPPKGDLNVHGRPTDKLDSEASRLSDIWGCKRTRAPSFRASQQAMDELPPVTVEELRSAIHTFPRHTAHTWDGLHPRHFGLLSDLQLEVVIALMYLIEQTGELPTCLQGVVATLIPKLKGEGKSFRSIGMMPVL